jgi:integrase
VPGMKCPAGVRDSRRSGYENFFACHEKAKVSDLVTKHISWHVFRHTFSTLLAENDEDVKTVQSLMRHANSNITMNIYTHAVSSKKRRALSKVVEMILREEKTTPVAAVSLNVYFLVYRADFPKVA